MAKALQTITEKNILEELSQYKWGNRFCCTKCGNDAYIKGRKDFSRRCRACKYDESLTKNTALEGLRFSITKACDILSKIHDRSIFNHDTKCIPTQGGRFITPIDYIDKCEKMGITRTTIGNNLLKFRKRYRPSIRAISKEFQVEENSVTKFLDKVNARISLHDAEEEENSYLRVKSFVQQMSYRPFPYFLSMLMVPLVGKWQYGEINIGYSRYAIEYDRFNERWDIMQILLSEVEDYVYIEEPLYKKNRADNALIRYGSERWKDLFVKGKIIKA